MDHLYLIGNGFDIFTGLHTSYRDFKRWLQLHYVFVYEAIEAAYGVHDIEWWNDFEVSLGKLDIQRFVELYTPPPKTEQEILNAIKEKKERKDSSEIFPPSLAYDSPCAKRLIGLFDIVGYCLRKWVLSFTSITDAKYIHLEKENSVFVNFNYTRTLELLYDIPEGNILHIHGSAFKSEKLVFGHNSSHRGMFYAFDAEKVSDALDTYEKNPYEYIFKNKTFFRKIEDVKHIHIYGLSLSPVDINYLV